MIKIFRRLSKRITAKYWYFWNFRKFRKIGNNCFIQKPIALSPRVIELGDSVIIRHHARIQGVSSYLGKKFNPRIILRNRVSIQQGIHLTCANYIEIGENTAIAAYVTITDIHHPYEDISMPIEKQAIVVKEVIIGSDCKIYNNAVILPGVHVGNHVTIGANCVVNKNIPDFSVVVGNPSRIVKRYNFQSRKWEKTNQDGSFITQLLNDIK